MPRRPKSRAEAELRASIVAKKRGNARRAKGRRKVERVSNQNSEQTPATVPQEAKQDGQTYSRWPWVERSVWSQRMLEALEKGVKGSKWFSLIDKVWKRDNLSAAWLQTTLNGVSPGMDGQSIREFNANLEREMQRLQRKLRERSYTRQPERRRWSDKLGSKEKRPLGIPAVRDRIVQGAMRNVLEPIWEREFAPHSYGFRPGRGCKDALRRVDSLLGSGH